MVHNRMLNIKYQNQKTCLFNLFSEEHNKKSNNIKYIVIPNNDLSITTYTNIIPILSVFISFGADILCKVVHN